MNEISYSMLTTTGVIATLIATLFAIAALVIASQRKKHHQAMQHAAAPAAAHAHPVVARPDAPMSFVGIPSAPPPPAPPSAVPAAVAVQSVAAADQVPVGVAPAPAVAPFMSQYRDCPNSVLVPPIATISSEATKRAALMARRSFMLGILI